MISTVLSTVMGQLDTRFCSTSWLPRFLVGPDDGGGRARPRSGGRVGPELRNCRAQYESIVP